MAMSTTAAPSPSDAARKNSRTSASARARSGGISSPPNRSATAAANGVGVTAAETSAGGKFVTLEPVTPHLGAVLRGVALSAAPDEETLAGIREALARHLAEDERKEAKK